MDSSFKETTLSWLATTDRDSRLEYFKEIMRCIRFEEIKPVKNMVKNAEKAKAPYRRTKKWKAARSVEDSKSAPASPKVAPVPERKKPWWAAEYAREDIVSLDCEMVMLHQKNENNKHIIQAATVAIVNWDDQVLYQGRVYHREGTYLVNQYTEKTTGFKGKMLEDGQNFSKIVNEVANILHGKLVIVCNGAADFSCLGLHRSEFDTFDLHDVWRKRSQQQDRFGEAVFQPISLRNVYYNYFKEDIQKGNHSEVRDARATMELFRDVYTKLAKAKNPYCRIYEMDDDEFEKFPKLKST